MKSIFNGRVASVFLVMLFFAVGFNPVFADKPNCPEDPTHPACKSDDTDPEPGDGVKSKVANWAAWESGYIYELDPAGGDWTGWPLALPRYCGGSDDNIDYSPHPGGWVAYGCHVVNPDSENVVVLDLRGLDLVESGSESSLCKRLTDPTNAFWPVAMGYPFSQPNMYSYSLDPTWNDGPCSEANAMETCLTRAHASAIFDERSGRKSGRLVILEGWGHVLAALPRTEDDLIEFNPFTRPQQMHIEEFTVTFRGIGRDKVVATCFFDNYDEQTGEYILPNLVFSTYLEDPSLP